MFFVEKYKETDPLKIASLCSQEPSLVADMSQSANNELWGKKLWQYQLVLNNGSKVFLIPQTKINNFILCCGVALFLHATDDKTLTEAEKDNLMLQAVKQFKSYHAANALFAKLAIEKRQLSLDALAEFGEWLESHFTPGWLLSSAMLLYMANHESNSNLRTNYYYESLRSFYCAKSLQDISLREIHNASFGRGIKKILSTLFGENLCDWRLVEQHLHSFAKGFGLQNGLSMVLPGIIKQGQERADGIISECGRLQLVENTV